MRSLAYVLALLSGFSSFACSSSDPKGSGGSPAEGEAGASSQSGGSTSAGGGSSGGGASSGGVGNSGGSGGSDADLAIVASNPCPSSGPCKILPFGDSITFGAGYGGSYRVELFRLAHSAGKDLTFVGSESNGPSTVDGASFPASHEGWYGWAIEPYGGRNGISTRVEAATAYGPHIVLLMIGTNDAIDDHELSAAPSRLGNLIDSIYAKLPSALVVLAQLVPSQDDALNARIQTYNAAMPELVRSRRDAGRNIALVDQYSPFVAVSTYKTSLLADTWHPNQAGSEKMAPVWYAAIADLLPAR